MQRGIDWQEAYTYAFQQVNSAREKVLERFSPYVTELINDNVFLEYFTDDVIYTIQTNTAKEQASKAQASKAQASKAQESKVQASEAQASKAQASEAQESKVKAYTGIISASEFLHHLSNLSIDQKNTANVKPSSKMQASEDEMRSFVQVLKSKYKLGECKNAARAFFERFPCSDLEFCIFDAMGESSNRQTTYAKFTDLPDCCNHVFIWHVDTGEITDPIFGIFRMGLHEYAEFISTQITFTAPFNENLILELQRSTFDQATETDLYFRKGFSPSGGDFILNVFYKRVPIKK